MCVFWTGCHSFIVSKNQLHLQICDANYGGYIPRKESKYFFVYGLMPHIFNRSTRV